MHGAHDDKLSSNTHMFRTSGKPLFPNLGARAVTHILMRVPCNLGLPSSLDYLDSIICFHFQVSLILKDVIGRADAWRLVLFFFLNSNDGFVWLYVPPPPMLWPPLWLVGSICKLLIWVKHTIYGPGTETVWFTYGWTHDSGLSNAPCLNHLNYLANRSMEWKLKITFSVG